MHSVSSPTFIMTDTFPDIKSKHSLVVKYVTEPLWEKLSWAVQFENQHCRIYAGDWDTYKDFSAVFDPLIQGESFYLGFYMNPDRFTGMFTSVLTCLFTCIFTLMKHVYAIYYYVQTLWHDCLHGCFKECAYIHECLQTNLLLRKKL